VAAVVVLIALVAAACANGVDTAAVDDHSTDPSARLATSTTVATGGSATSSSSKSKATTASSQQLSGTAQELVSKLASDPALLQQLTGADAATISRLTGIPASELAGLHITPQTIQALGTILSGLDPATLQEVSRTGKLDPQVATTILTLAAQLDPAAAASLKSVNPLAIVSLISTATTVDPKVTATLGTVLGAIDPNGLGRLANDQSSLAILAVLFGAALRTDPSQFANLANANNLDPNVDYVLTAVQRLVSGLTPEVVYALNGLSKVLGPDLLKALATVMAMLGRPDVAPVVQAAAKNPVVLVTTLGTFALLVPGLAEVLAPDVFGKNPTARYAALAAMIGLAIANLNGLDLDALAKLLGLPPLPAGLGG
jgi:hypothetical protein